MQFSQMLADLKEYATGLSIDIQDESNTIKEGGMRIQCLIKMLF
jgi:hypothetical protein